MSLALEVLDTTAMFRTLQLYLVTLRHEIASYIRKSNPAFYEANRAIILNMPITLSVLGKTEDEWTMKQERARGKWKSGKKHMAGMTVMRGVKYLTF